jgi:hypothetical protein
MPRDVAGAVRQLPRAQIYARWFLYTREDGLSDHLYYQSRKCDRHHYLSDKRKSSLGRAGQFVTC